MNLWAHTRTCSISIIMFIEEINKQIDVIIIVQFINAM